MATRSGPQSPNRSNYSCRNVSNWIIAAKRNITDDTLKNSRRKTGYSYFRVFGDAGEFKGDDAIIGDDPNKPDVFNTLNEQDANEEGDKGDI